jgi:hypothetical protein
MSVGKDEFADRAELASDIRDKLQEADLKDKLRALYSTACHAKAHINDFVQAGFCVASGATGVNANGPIEYPAFMLAWRSGKTFEFALARVPKLLVELYDDAAEWVLGDAFGEIDSTKHYEGKKNARITSEPESPSGILRFLPRRAR